MKDQIDAFIACRCPACVQLDAATADMFPDSESPEVRACWEEIEKTCPNVAGAFGAVCAAVDEDKQQQELFR